ncbi:hypothetical protein C8R44DRAFT_807209 [Mycena epipterygia]|nr:hypothetical protein C8R44DRAFT_807209 [Mycena epipterygia]
MVYKKVDPLTEPANIEVEPGKVLRTTIHPETRKHHITCDLCSAAFTLTITANPRVFLDHRGSQACITREEKREKRRQKASETAAASSATMQSILTQGSTPLVHRPYHSSDSGPSGSITPRPDLQQSLYARTPSMIFVREGVANLEPVTPMSRGQAQQKRPELQTKIETVACPGVSVEWTSGSIWDTYPYLQHAYRDVGWEPVGFNSSNNSIQLRAENCQFPISGGDSQRACVSCKTLRYSAYLKQFMDRSEEVSDHTPWDYLTAQQHKVLLAKMRAQVMKLRTQLDNAKKTYEVLGQKMTDHQRITMLLASNDVPGLRRILTVALKRGASPQAIYSILERAIAGLFSPRGGFTDRDLDVSFLVKALGGPRLLYALQKSHGLASRTTVMKNQKIPKLRSSIGVPTREDIDFNISSMLHPEIKPDPPDKRVGNAVMFDGVALETKCRYCPTRNAILGLCREHSHRVDTQVTDFESVEKVRTALFSPESEEEKVCFGSDATVVAIAPYGRDDHYTPTPIVVSPSDKTEKGKELAVWMQTLIDAWRENPNGEARHGPIWALASDGDAAYRLAKHILTMVQALDSASELGKQLRTLDGLNLLTSTVGDIIGTGDPKHVWKRFGTLLRNPLGIMIFEMNIKPEDIIQHLRDLDKMDEEMASQLLDPGDKQNVPKAVSLVQHLEKLRDLPIPTNPTMAHQRNTIMFFSEVLGCFVRPFISMDMDLSEQVRSLSTYAHLLAGLQITHGSACFTGPLYADSQSIVKNIIFIIARMKIINPNLRFWILHEGTDRLELVFCDTRTLDHARNFDIEQLTSKLSLSALINAAFQRNPDLDRGHRRLSLKGAMGIDHVNPKSCTANVRVGDVDLHREWFGGRDEANQIFKKYFGQGAQIDFKKHFSQVDHDMQRPLGVYVGVRETLDDKRSESENTSWSPAHMFNEGTLPATVTTEPNETSGSVSAVSVPIPTSVPISSAIATASAPTAPSDDGMDPEQFLDPVRSSSPDALGMDLDDFLPDTTSGIDTDALPTAASKYIEAGGKRFLKSSVVASLSSNRTKKVTMRTLRAQGVALEDLQKRKSTQLDLLDLSDEQVVKAGDLAGTLFQSGNKICLAVLMIKGFRVGKDKTVRTIIEAKELEKTEAHIRVVAQVMELENPRTSRSVISPPENFWEWTGKFIMLDLDAASTRLTHNQLILEVPSVVVHPLGPTMAARTSFDPGSTDKRPTWRIDSEQLKQVMDSLWLSLDPESSEMLENMQLLPFISNPQALPYLDADGQQAFIVQNVPGHLTPMPKLPGKTSVPCLICDKTLALNKMREHVGGHILLSLRQVEESGPLQNKVGPEPCGFCGWEGCVTQLKISKEGKHSIKSSCKYHYEKMQYKAAKASSKRSPCTNVPLHCSLCKKSNTGLPRTFWKYNASYHLASDHSNNNETLPVIPKQMMVDIFIRKQEESQLGVTARITEEYRREERIPDSDAIDAMMFTLNEEQSGRRARAGTGSTVSSTDAHKTKKAKGR